MLAARETEQRWWQAPRPGINWRSAQAAGLLAWWPCRGSAGQSQLDELCQRAVGSFGLGVDWTPDPLYGAALRFTGTTQGYSMLPVLNFAAPLTLAAWVRPDFANATGQRAFAKILSKAHSSLADPYALVGLWDRRGEPGALERGGLDGPRRLSGQCQ